MASDHARIVPWGMLLGVAACVLSASDVAHAQDPCGVDVPTLPAITLTPGEYYARVGTTPTETAQLVADLARV